MVKREKQLDILHDHYKETVARQQQVEASRDRLFLLVIALYGLLSFEVGYPTSFNGVGGKIGIAGVEFTPASVPLPALLDVTWAFTLAITLRYCQTALAIDRQYDYIHYLEEVISPLLGGENRYQREGKVYLHEYPPLLNLAWFAYWVVFPFLILGGAIALVGWELVHLSYAWPHRVLDSLIGISVVACMVIYRIQPALARAWKKVSAWYLDLTSGSIN